MTEAKEKKIERDIAALFGEVHRVPVEVDPHLSTRVLARWRERSETKSVSPIWRWVGVGASSLSAALGAVLFFWFTQAPRFEAFVGQPFVVKIEVRDLGAARIAKARIRLPEGVYFDIEDYPELRKSRELLLAWEKRDQSEFIPFVLTAAEEGTKTISVDFFDAQGRLVGAKRVEVRLRKSDLKG